MQAGPSAPPSAVRRAPGALPTPAASVPDPDNVIAELLDENRLLEQEVADSKREADERGTQLEQVVERNTRREKSITDCLEALVGYCTMLEQNVVQPAIGRLLECLSSHHWEVADAREDLVSRVSALPVSASAQPKLVKLFGHFQQPGAAPAVAASDERRRQVWDAVAQGEPYYEPEDAYTMVALLLQEKEQLSMILRFCSQELQGLREAQAHHSDTQGRSAEYVRRQTAVLQQQNDSLKAEVQRLEQAAAAAAAQAQEAALHRERNERDVQSLVADLQALKAQNQTLQADFQLVLQEKTILLQQGESLETTVRQERAILNQKVESLQNTVAQLQSQRDAMRDRAERAERECSDAGRAAERLRAVEHELQVAQKAVDDAERRALHLEQERAVVRQKFQTVERALTQGASEKQALREEVEDLRQRLNSTFPGAASDAATREKLYQERAESHRLRIELERLQQTRGGAPDADGLRREVAQLRSELDAQRHAHSQQLEQSRRSEGELQERVRQLQAIAQRLKQELEQVVSQRELGGAGAGAASGAPLPNGIADGMRGRITSFEMCINQLNSELGNVEGRINSLERGGEQSSAQLAARLERERQQFEQERSECDQIVQRMADELELLIRENQQLKAQSQRGPDLTGAWGLAASPGRIGEMQRTAPPPAPSPSPPQHGGLGGAWGGFGRHA
eukprot:TRINITY_DN1199_c0_g4_i1.p1 TRINITY_DN1199_c0_g4~~TRINITY_DN1199_c0_g4_i1.p1  ORF type:complete len:713 (+),score=326.82 TRINITY_DN1199_c0_g4_i1:83-2140(+)